MSDYIKREDAIERLSYHADFYQNDREFGGEEMLYKDSALNEISELPSADVRKNIRGEWLPHPNKQNKEWDVCSACGIGCKRREYGIHANGDKWVTEYSFSYCPNCGAEMRGDNK